MLGNVLGIFHLNSEAFWNMTMMEYIAAIEAHNSMHTSQEDKNKSPISDGDYLHRLLAGLDT